MMAGSMLGTLYVIGGPGMTVRELVGGLMGMVLIGFTMQFTANRTVERVWLDLAEREVDEALRRLADLQEAERRGLAGASGSDRYADHPPVVPPMYPPEYDPVGRAVDESVTRYLDEELDPNGYAPTESRGWVYDHQRQGWVAPQETVTRAADQLPETWLGPLGYVADPERPWRAVRPSGTGRVGVPLPPRDQGEEDTQIITPQG
jgi:hypothetical protein